MTTPNSPEDAAREGAFKEALEAAQIEAARLDASETKSAWQYHGARASAFEEVTAALATEAKDYFGAGIDDKALLLREWGRKTKVLGAHERELQRAYG